MKHNWVYYPLDDGEVEPVEKGNVRLTFICSNPNCNRYACLDVAPPVNLKMINMALEHANEMNDCGVEIPKDTPCKTFKFPRED